jgi:hypothetical protein
VVIDELIVVLGLDTTKFTDGQRDALAAFKKTREGADQFGKDVEAQGMKLSEVFGVARKGVLGLMGAFVGGEAVSFINHIANMDASTGRMSKTIKTSVENLSLWQNMLGQVGGEASSATSALSTLQQEINNVRQGGGMFDGGFGSLMNQAGVSIRDDADSSLRKIRSYISGQIGSGKMTADEGATYLRRVPGMNQDMVNLLLGDFEKIEAAAKKVGGATKESAEAAQALQSQLHLVVQGLEQFGRGLIPIVNLLMKPLKEITKDDVTKSGAFSGGVTFDKGSFMDRLDTWLWGEYGQHGDAGGGASFSDRFGAGGGAKTAGTSRGDRNNNPGNIEYGAFAKAHGATGSDGRFAIFPDAAAGESAMADLLAKNYAGLNLAQIQRKWVGNEDPSYLASMSRSTGLGAGDVPNLSDAGVRSRLITGMARGEGSHLGARGAAAARGGGASSTSTSTSSVSIGQIVLPGVKDADGFAREVEPAMKRSSLIAPANYGLT